MAVEAECEGKGEQSISRISLMYPIAQRHLHSHLYPLYLTVLPCSAKYAMLYMYQLHAPMLILYWLLLVYTA